MFITLLCFSSASDTVTEEKEKTEKQEKSEKTEKNDKPKKSDSRSSKRKSGSEGNRGKRPRKEPEIRAPSSRRVYIANIPYDAKWQDIKDLFREKSNGYGCKPLFCPQSLIVIVIPFVLFYF